MLETLTNTWRHWDLVVSFMLRDVKARYKQTALGAAWAVLQPFSMMVVFTLVFSLFAKVPSDGQPYPLFAYTALIFWTFFANTISAGTLAMVANGPLIRKIYFPRETLLVSVLLAGLFDLLVALVLCVGMLLYYKVALTLAVLWVIPLLLLQMILSFGVMSLTAAAHVNYRDIGHALPLTMQLWMFATPVAYPITVIPAWLKPFYLLNPMATVIDGYRRALLLGTGPDPGALLLSTAIACLLTAVATTVFKRSEKTFADII
jgi:homopolymeric O-antigen transport system permease protein